MAAMPGGAGVSAITSHLFQRLISWHEGKERMEERPQQRGGGGAGWRTVTMKTAIT